MAAVFAKHDVGAVIHFAGYKAVGESVAKPLSYYENNLGSTFSSTDSGDACSAVSTPCAAGLYRDVEPTLSSDRTCDECDAMGGLPHMPRACGIGGGGPCPPCPLLSSTADDSCGKATSRWARGVVGRLRLGSSGISPPSPRSVASSFRWLTLWLLP